MKKLVLAVLAATLLSGCLLWEDYDDYDDEEWFASPSAPAETAR